MVASFLSTEPLSAPRCSVSCPRVPTSDAKKPAKFWVVHPAAAVWVARTDGVPAHPQSAGREAGEFAEGARQAPRGVVHFWVATAVSALVVALWRVPRLRAVHSDASRCVLSIEEHVQFVVLLAWMCLMRRRGALPSCLWVAARQAPVPSAASASPGVPATVVSAGFDAGTPKRCVISAALMNGPVAVHLLVPTVGLQDRDCAVPRPLLEPRSGATPAPLVGGV